MTSHYSPPTDQSLIELRHTLHQFPELAHQEEQTANIVSSFLKELHPEILIEKNIGGNGLLASLVFSEPGPSLLFRAELDALPIQEISTLSYASQTSGVAHVCGHDGHMTILCGLASVLFAKPLERGAVHLLFQPAEETGEGAELVLNDTRIERLELDGVFALHNVPGYPLGQIVVRPGPMCMASTGLIFTLEGRTSHAAQPEDGASPVEAIKTLIEVTQAITTSVQGALATLVGIECGEKAFGTAPGSAQVYLTLRASTSSLLDDCFNQLQERCRSTCKASGILLKVDRVEPFTETVNDEGLVQKIQEVASESGLSTFERNEPFRWSEDFGKFTTRWPGALIGLGSGEAQPQLHNPDYDFPDELLSPGIKLFESIARKLTAP